MNGLESLGEKVSQSEAGYMELVAATKDSGCEKVSGRISANCGCCNLFQPESSSTNKFSCGTCEYLSKE